ncbi:hypothetical protein BGZ49_007875 [Haplosporangium sp. Z 27]|nr:hypothetical protein BGZ49_007875 [Haplosporangium sp. Z 27]
MRNGASKEKTLSIHIDTDYIGPNGLPLVYGSTPDKVGKIKGSVRFSSTYECRGKDIAILYEAKAEAHWTSFENKKIIQHNTEEILGHHIWHFPLEHTKAGGKKIVPGSYEKAFEIPLIHPSILNKTSHPSSSPALMSTQAAPVVLLPSSSDNPYAQMKYTVRAILRRPFPSMHNIEAVQEVWVLQSSLPPPNHQKRPSNPKNVLQMTTTSDHHSTPSTSISSPEPQNATNIDTSATLSKSSQSSTLDQDPSSPLPPLPPSTTTHAHTVSLPTPTTVLKSALAFLPSIDLLRPKHTHNVSATKAPTPEPPSPPVATKETLLEDHPGEEKTAPAVTSPLETLDSSTSTSSLELTSNTSGEDSSSTDEGSDDEDSVNYTGVWEPFRIPYSCSIPSETVYLGQTVPITIRFGPNRRSRKKQRDSKKRKHSGGKRHGNRHDKEEDIYEEEEEQDSPHYRFVVKKGILKVVEHTHLREFSAAPPVVYRSQKANPIIMIDGSTFPSNANFYDQEQQQHRNLQDNSLEQSRTSNVDRSGSPMIPGNAKGQSKAQIYQQKTFSGSHPQLYDHKNELNPNHQDSKAPSEDLGAQRLNSKDSNIKRLFRPMRHSMDVTPRTNSISHRRDSPPLRVQSPTNQGFPPLPPPANAASTRIVNSIEAKFKTDVLTVSLTPQLQERESQYQRRLHRKNKKVQGNGNGQEIQNYDDDEEEKEEDGEESEEEDRKMIQRRSYGSQNIWRDTIWVQIPGPSELATYTSTKHIVKKHKLQLILLCGLVDESSESDMDAEVVPSAVGLMDSVIMRPGINKEFRLEMDLHVTGPRAPESTE